MSEKLLPCPFCGRTALIEDGRNDRPWVVQCNNPNCHAQPFMDHADTKAQAIAAWNQRTRPDELIEALRDNKQGWDNALELGLIPPQHRDTAQRLSDRAKAALAKWGE